MLIKFQCPASRNALPLPPHPEEAGQTVWRAKHPPAPYMAAVLIEALDLEPGRIVRLIVEKVYGLQARVDIVIEAL